MKLLVTAAAAALLACGCSRSSAPVPYVHGAPPSPPPDRVLEIYSDMMTAVQHGNYQVFLSRGNETFRSEVSSLAFQNVHTQVARQMETGYQSIYWGELRQGTYRVFCWKVVFNDGSDDLFVRLTMDGNRAAGILFQ